MSISRAFGIAPLAVAVLMLAGTPESQAGKLDHELLKNVSHLYEYLSERKVKNVGVLPFEVKKGSRKASFDAAPLATIMPTRLENTLIMRLETDSFGVVRSAARTASRAKVGNYLRNKADFDKLFATKYLRAWDGAKVSVDCFLTGRIENSAKDRSKTKVIIEAFDASSWKDGAFVRKLVVDFEVPTDRILLADQGYNYSLPQAALSAKLGAADRTKLAVKLIATRDAASEDDQIDTASPENIAGFAFQVLYDGTPQEIKIVQSTTDGQKAPEYELPPAAPNTKIVMRLKRTDASDRKLGVVLKVNGVSTCDKEDGDSHQCRRWVYKNSPGVVGSWQDYEGYYMGPDASKLSPFASIGAEAAEELFEGNARVGWIDIDVYASMEERKAVANPLEKAEKYSPLIMTRSLPPTTDVSRSFLAYQKALFAANGQVQTKNKFRTRTVGGIGYSDAAPVPIPPTPQTNFPNPEPIGHLSIRYRSTK